LWKLQLEKELSPKLGGPRLCTPITHLIPFVVSQVLVSVVGKIS